jgi:hypothetical protein
MELVLKIISFHISQITHFIQLLNVLSTHEQLVHILHLVLLLFWIRVFVLFVTYFDQSQVHCI